MFLEISVYPLPNKTINPISPRELAAKLLQKWDEQPCGKKTPIEDIGANYLRQYPLKENDIHFFWELIFGVARHLRLLDTEIQKRLAQNKRLPPEIMSTLRVAAYQILFLSRTPDYAVVNEAVQLSKNSRHSWAKDLCNAVLRRLIREKSSWSHVQDCKSPHQLAIMTSHPDWMVERWWQTLGKEAATKCSTWNNTRAPLTLRVNTTKTDVAEAISWLDSHGIKATATRYSHVGINLEGFSGSITRLDWFQTGMFQVQDEASQIVSMLAYKEKDMRGMKVLDACAGLGGKTTHLSQLVGKEGCVTAFDTNKQRLKLLQENAKRLGLQNITITHDKKQLVDIGATQPFDLVLVDAPCSGLGVIRRHPDIKWNRTSGDIARFASQQAELLSNFSELTAREGRLIYSVCTQEPEETTETIRNFILQRTNWTFARFPEEIKGRLEQHARSELTGVIGDIFLPLPQDNENGMDLFFACCLKGGSKK